MGDRLFKLSFNVKHFHRKPNKRFPKASEASGDRAGSAHTEHTDCIIKPLTGMTLQAGLGLKVKIS